MSPRTLDQRAEETRPPSALAAAQEPLDGLAFLCQTGAGDGLGRWLLAAESDLWHGYLFSRVPVAGSTIQSHVRSLAEHYRRRVPQALTRAVPSGLFPVQSSHEESAPVAQDREIPGYCTARIGISGGNVHGPDERELVDQASEAARMAADGQGWPFLHA